ncbi:MAG: fused MFS/spermidine synthase, partial [Acidobacteria bacterium]|nr:fused MFS/spermidine synthase [Acidobacteriota bacterium]
TRVIPYWSADLHRPILVVQAVDLLRCAAAILPAAILWGASFPLALAAFGAKSADTGRSAARVYAANTLGALVGALAFTFLGVPVLGSRASQQVLVAVAGCAALLVHLLPRRLPRSAGDGNAPAPFPGLPGFPAKPIPGLLAVMGATAISIALLPEVPVAMLTYGRNLDKWKIIGRVPYLEEGMVSTVAVQQREEGITYFHVSGKVEATTEPEDMRLQRMMGHIPALIHPNPRSVLVIGMGAAVTAGSFVVHPGVERIVICEIEPRVFDAASRYFGDANHHVLEDPRVQVVFDDARHFLATTGEKFDVITSDPIHPWVRGVAALYTQEQYELERRHLNPGGVVAQWLPFYETSEKAVKIELRTFMEAFPGGTIWSADATRVGTDAVMAAQVEPMRIDLLRAESRIRQNPRLARSLADVQMGTALTLFATYAGRGEDLAPWLADTAPNRDLDLKLEYEAGRSLNMQVSNRIFAAIRSRRRFPEDLFVGPPESVRILRGLVLR